MTALAKELTTARTLLLPASAASAAPPGPSRSSPLPVGVGFILAHPSAASHFLASALPVLREHRPAAVWLFAPRPEDLVSGSVADIVAALRGEGFTVAFQVGSVAAARQAARDGADVLVVQGADAGGHQSAFECGGAGVVSLVPEVVDMLEAEFPAAPREVAVVAAGGIVEGRGVAAALALGEWVNHDYIAPARFWFRMLYGMMEADDGCGVVTAKGRTGS